jgi:SAM-dependent methyltransferase
VSDEQGWAGYYAANAGRQVRPLFTRALAEYGEVSDGDTALDVGCGDGTETRALLDAGFRVTAVDEDPDAVRRSADLAGDERLTFVAAPMQRVVWPHVDLLHAGLSLPFCPPEDFDALWTGLRDALVPGGVLAADFFGDRDSWALQGGPLGPMTFVTRERLDVLLAGLHVVGIEEEDEDGRSVFGPKHWHRFEVVARRPVVR